MPRPIALFGIIGYFIIPMNSTVAVITGGSSGIGKALAEKCLQKGYKVIIGARRKDVLKQCEAELSAYAGDSGAVSSCVP